MNLLSRGRPLDEVLASKASIGIIAGRCLFLRKSCSEEEMPGIIKFEPGCHIIETIMKDGEPRVYKVERMMGDFPLYAVKMHTKDRGMTRLQDCKDNKR